MAPISSHGFLQGGGRRVRIKTKDVVTETEGAMRCGVMTRDVGCSL